MNMQASFDISHGMNVETLMRSLEAIPKHARVSVHVTPRDRPWDSETTTLRFTWSK